MTSPTVQEEGWIEHDGGENPVPGERVDVRLRGGHAFDCRDGGPCASSESDLARWSHKGFASDIIAYRVVSAPLGEPEDQGPSALRSDTHRAPEGAVVADALTERLTKVAYATEFLDVREDILALIERDRRRWLDNIAVCELLAKARADLAHLGGPDRPRR